MVSLAVVCKLQLSLVRLLQKLGLLWRVLQSVCCWHVREPCICYGAVVEAEQHRSHVLVEAVHLFGIYAVEQVVELGVGEVCDVDEIVHVFLPCILIYSPRL